MISYPRWHETPEARWAAYGMKPSVKIRERVVWEFGEGLGVVGRAIWPQEFARFRTRLISRKR